MEFVGWLSGVALAICGAPLAVQVYKQKHAIGISSGFLWLWYAGEIGMLIYTIAEVGALGPFLVNYIFNMLFISVVIYYKYFGESK